MSIEDFYVSQAYFIFSSWVVPYGGGGARYYRR